MLYIQSRANMTLGVIEEFYNDTHQMILSSGVSSYTFTVAKNIEDSQHLVEGNYVIVTDDQGLGWKFTIMNTTQTHTEITVYCEDIGLELVNKVMDAWSAPTTKQPASYYIDKAIKDTKWKIGLNEISNLSRTLKWEGRDTSLNRLLSICTEFDHAEIEFRVQFKNLQVTNYIINIYKSRGADRSDIQLVYGDTVNDITKTSSIEELATAIMGVGSDKELPENAPQGTIPDKVTFKDLTYDDGFFFTKAGDPFLRARVANQQFNLREGYIEDYYEYDTSDPQELLNRTITQLKERSEIKVNYEVSVVKFDKSLQLGDTITIIDHDYKPELLLSGRVLELDKSYTDASQDKLVLGNFLILYSNINDKLYNLQNQIKNMKVDNNYMWLRYAKDDKGNGMTSTPTADTQYVAILVNKKTGIPSDNPADYVGHWQLIKGNDGSDGIPGPKGEDGKTSYTHFAYADNVSGTEDFSTDDPTGRSYMGVYSDFTKADSTDPSDYVWSYTKGEAGPVGRDGAQGIPGKPGADGKTPYTHVAYADDDKGGGFSQSPDNKAYMGWYSDFTQVNSNDPSQYAWSLIKGANGADGQSVWSYPYNRGANRLGSYWSDLKPAPTTANPPKVGDTIIDMIGNMYQITNVVVGGGGGGGTFDYGSLITNIKGSDGKDGIAGKDGVGIKSTAVTYQASTSGTTAPTGTWVASPTAIAGQYQWTKTVWTYTDGTTEVGYSVGHIGADGATGKDGIAGKDGVGIKSTAITYATSTSGTSAPTSGWVSTPPSAIAGQFIWTRTIWTYTDNTTETGYSVGKIGEKGETGANGAPGKPGADGKTPYFHQAWADSKDGKINFSATDPTNRGYLGTYTDYTQADSTDPTKYFWVELVGNLQVGVRNLLKGTADFSDGANVYGANGTVVTDEVYNGNRVLKEPKLTASNAYHDPYNPYTIDVAKGEYYALSFYARADVPSMVMRCYFYSPTNTISSINSQGFESASADGLSTFTITNQWKQYWVVWKTNINTTAKRVIIGRRERSVAGSDTGSIFINSPMLVEGNKAVGWQPAPEDTQGQIDSVNQALVQANNKINAVPHVSAQSSAPTNPKQGDQWWVLSKDPTTGKDSIEAFKQWNGTQWEDAPIQQSAMNIGTLNGNVINGATINGSEFTNNFDFTGIDKVHFQGVTQIKDGAVNITWKILENNQTGNTTLNADGLESIIRDPKGAIVRSARLQMGELELSDGHVFGRLNEQDSYRNSGVPIYLNGWASWNEGFKVRIARNGRQVTISGYIKHNGSETISPMLQLPAWACPAQNEIVNATSFDARVFNNTACNLSLKLDGRLVNNAGTQKGGYLSFSSSYTGVDIK